MNRFSKYTDGRLSFLLAIHVLLGVMLVFLPAVLFSIFKIVQNGEKRFVQTEVDQSESVLQNELAQMDTLIHGFSSWDDTYTFALDQNQDYIDKNLTDPAFPDGDLHFLIVVDPSGKAVYAKYYDPQNQEDPPFPFQIAPFLQSYPELLRFPDEHTGRIGLVSFSHMPMLVVARPVLTSLETGPAHGTLIGVRILGPQELDSLSQLTHRKINLIGSEQAAASIPTLPSAAVLMDQVFVQPVDSQTSIGYKYLQDLHGQPALVLGVENKRDLYHQGVKTAWIFTGSLLTLALLLSGVTYCFFRSTLRVRRSIRQNLERFQMVIDQSRDAIIQITGYFQILELNPAARELLGIKTGYPQAISLQSILTFEPALDETRLYDLCDRRAIGEFLCVRRDGAHLDLELSAARISGALFPAFSLMLHDVTARKKTEADLQEAAALLTERNEALRASNEALHASNEALKTSEERYMLSAKGSHDGLWDLNLITGEIYYSARWKEMLGFGEDELQPDPQVWFSRLHPDDLFHFRIALAEHLLRHTEHFECEYRIAPKEGSSGAGSEGAEPPARTYRWMQARGLAVWDEQGNALRIAGSQTDITERKEIEEQLRYDALHDGLTGVANRTLLLDHLKHVNDRKKRNPNSIFAMFFLDLDRFKQVNDTMGHQAGDQLLVETAHRLQTGLRSIDTVSRFVGPETLARIAGDEFVILLEDFNNTDDIQKVTHRIIQVFDAPYQIAGRELSLSASLGYVIPDQAYDQVEDIIRDADIAMYQAKQLGSGQAVCFQKEMYQQTLRRIQVENELRQAVEHREFEVYYQPIYTLADERMIGVEALVRWNHPVRGMLLPSEFIDVAEETGLIVPIGYWVLEESCRRMQAWSQQFHTVTEFIVSVNLSVHQIMSPNLVDTIQTILAATGLNPKKIWLEVTENVLLENSDLVIGQLKELREMGIRIEIDDFGTGYSSLSYLQNLPIDGFKIDRLFVRDIASEGRQIVKTLVDLGHSMGLTEVAEGVETDLQKDYLKTVACDFMQGYLMSRPVNAQGIEDLLRIKEV
jgi:diguanylate cyclase (GGDEF)-like protein/PAS domain S-box-containing protein